MIDWDRALLRGRYMKALSQIEWHGVAIDAERYTRLRAAWPDLIRRLIAEIDGNYHVFVGTTFNARRWEHWLDEQGIRWPRSKSGSLRLDRDTFCDMSRIHPQVAPMHQLQVARSQMKLGALHIGRDGRNRCLLSPFAALTGRNQPSTTHFIFGPAAWMRDLIRPTAGYGLAYVDWCQQEFGTAAALSGDKAMMNAYQSGDPYLAFARQARAIPSTATRASHRQMREQYKVCALAMQYGMGADSLAVRIGKSVYAARELIRAHRRTFPDFWRWSDAVVDAAIFHRRQQTVFGWTRHLNVGANERSLRNFPVQANGAEMLRLACCFAIERGVRVCAPIHDALLIEAPLRDLDDAVAETQGVMAEASAIVLGGFQLRSEANVIRYPNHFSDPRGVHVWQKMLELLEEAS